MDIDYVSLTNSIKAFPCRGPSKMVYVPYSSFHTMLFITPWIKTKVGYVFTSKCFAMSLLRFPSIYVRCSNNYKYRNNFYILNIALQLLEFLRQFSALTAPLLFIMSFYSILEHQTWQTIYHYSRRVKLFHKSHCWWVLLPLSIIWLEYHRPADVIARKHATTRILSLTYIIKELQFHVTHNTLFEIIWTNVKRRTDSPPEN